MALKSKLSSAYPTAAMAHLTGWEELDPVFAGRLAYLAKDKNVKLHITEGYRSTARQAELYKMYQDYLRTGKGSIKLAARPGTSWHEYRLAIDTSTQPIRSMTNAQLKPYGLCKPIASEGWHIQPIETSGKSNKAAYAPEEVENVDIKDIMDKLEELIDKKIENHSQIYKMPKDVPSWAQPNIDRLIAKGAIAPDKKDGSINLTHEMVRILAIVDRMVG